MKEKNKEYEITHFTFKTTEQNLRYLLNHDVKGKAKYAELKTHDYEFIIFDFNNKHKWSPEYKDMLKKSFLCKDRVQYTLEIDETYPMYLTLKDDILQIDDDDYNILVLLPTFKNWVKYQNKNEVPLNNSYELHLFLHENYTKKMVSNGYIPDKKLQPTLACVICKNNIVGCAISIYNKDFDYSISSSSIHDYISKVEIIEEYQNKGLCTPLLTYLLDYLIFVKNIRSIYIDNLSDTDSGIGPGVSACLCYLRSGFYNDFQIYLDDENGIKLIKDSFCVNGENHNDESYIYQR